MEDKRLLGDIEKLVTEEHELRERLANGQLDASEEQQRLAAVERSLDQCWDLLRQRRARREAGESVDDARVRPAGEVEGYLQ
jgi:hypothetical protein